MYEISPITGKRLMDEAQRPSVANIYNTIAITANAQEATISNGEIYHQLNQGKVLFLQRVGLSGNFTESNWSH